MGFLIAENDFPVFPQPFLFISCRLCALVVTARRRYYQALPYQLMGYRPCFYHCHIVLGYCYLVHYTFGSL